MTISARHHVTMFLVGMLIGTPVHAQGAGRRASTDPQTSSANDPAVAAADPSDPPTADPSGPAISLDNVRHRLEQDPSVDLASASATAVAGAAGRPVFRVKTEGLRFDLDKVYKLSHPPPPPPPPAMGIDLLSLIRGGIAGTVRAYKERQARDAYRQAMDDYCAAYPEQAKALPDCRVFESPQPTR